MSEQKTTQAVVRDVTREQGLPLGRYRKTATIRAVRLHAPFSVVAKEGTLYGSAGDWLAVADDDCEETPHRWIISAKDFFATYAPDSIPSTTDTQ